jgi:hypothetical protein
LQAALAQPIAAAFPGATWADAQVPTPAGTSVTFKRLRAEGPQDFVNLQTNAVVKQDGRFDLYLVDAGAYHVLLGWRAAKGQGELRQYPASEAAMGTIVISEPPAADGQAAPAAAGQVGRAPAGCAFAPPRLGPQQAAGKLARSAASAMNAMKPGSLVVSVPWSERRRLHIALGRDSSVG